MDEALANFVCREDQLVEHGAYDEVQWDRARMYWSWQSLM